MAMKKRVAKQHTHEVRNPNKVHILPEVQSAIILMPGECVKGCWDAFFDDNDVKQDLRDSRQSTYQGHLVATNRKLIFLEKKGLLSKRYFTKDSTNWEDVQGISISGLLIKNITITKQIQGALHEHAFSNIKKEDGRLMLKDELINFKGTLESFIQKRFAEIEREKKESKIQYVIDFSFLKAEMEKGGITLTTIKCPSCGANVNMPETGRSFQCQYCESTIHAHDVFDKMKALIGGL